MEVDGFSTSRGHARAVIELTEALSRNPNPWFGPDGSCGLLGGRNKGRNCPFPTSSLNKKGICPSSSYSPDVVSILGTTEGRLIPIHTIPV